jgi:hypothetical protein
VTLSFTAGSILNIKSGRLVEIEQRTFGKKVWAPDDSEPDPSWPRWMFQQREAHADASDLAVAIGLTHDVSAKVTEYVQNALPSVRRILVATLSSGPSARSVTCGRHAFDLAEALTAQVKSLREVGGLTGKVHLFMAGPGGFSFYLGQRQTAIGPLILYEFDFEGTQGASYEPSLSLPIC